MKRPDYQSTDDLETITDKRNAEIRAWGRKQLADADALLMSEVRDGGDWDLIDREEKETIPKTPKSRASRADSPS